MEETEKLPGKEASIQGPEAFLAIFEFNED